MPANRFELVDEPQANAITLSLSERGGEAFGRVPCPAELAPGIRSMISSVTNWRRRMPSVMAVRLANEPRAPMIVVEDAAGVWQEERSVHYREM